MVICRNCFFAIILLSANAYFAEGAGLSDPIPGQTQSKQNFEKQEQQSSDLTVKKPQPPQDNTTDVHNNDEANNESNSERLHKERDIAEPKAQDDLVRTQSEKAPHETVNTRSTEEQIKLAAIDERLDRMESMLTRPVDGKSQKETSSDKQGKEKPNKKAKIQTKDENFKLIIEMQDKLKELLESNAGKFRYYNSEQFDSFLEMLSALISGFKSMDEIIEGAKGEITSIKDRYQKVVDRCNDAYTSLLILLSLANEDEGLIIMASKMDGAKPLDKAEIEELLDKTLSLARSSSDENGKKIINDFESSILKSMDGEVPKIPSYIVLSTVYCFMQAMIKNKDLLDTIQREFITKFDSLIIYINNMAAGLKSASESKETPDSLKPGIVAQWKSVAKAVLVLKDSLKLMKEGVDNIVHFMNSVLKILEKAEPGKRDMMALSFVEQQAVNQAKTK